MFKTCHKTCSKPEKTWFLLVHWVANNSKMYEKKTEAVVQRCYIKKEFLKISKKTKFVKHL